MLYQYAIWHNIIKFESMLAPMTADEKDYDIRLESLYYSIACCVYLHAALCGIPVLNSNINLHFSSTLAGSVLILTCQNDTVTDHDEQILIATCHRNGSWIPNPAQYKCAPLPGIVHLFN